MGRVRPGKKESSFFRNSEIEQLEKVFTEAVERSLNKSFYEKLAKKFNLNSGRSGKAALQWDQVKNWFQSKRLEQERKTSSSPTSTEKEEFVPSSDDQSNCAPESSTAPESSSNVLKGEKTQDISMFEFEARSTKDGACGTETSANHPLGEHGMYVTFDFDFSKKIYENASTNCRYDVHSFLTYRVLHSGESEVRVRFVGYGAEEDEWVNIKTAVRKRSFHLEPSECWKVAVGDLVLCFQERRDHATYYDAHILQIQRRAHDIRGCRCIFLIRYDHDKAEEKVPLRRICRTQPTDFSS